MFWDPGAWWRPSLFALCVMGSYMAEGRPEQGMGYSRKSPWVTVMLSKSNGFFRVGTSAILFVKQKPVLGQPCSEQKGGLDEGKKENAPWVRVRRYGKRLCSHHQLSPAPLKRRKGKRITSTSMHCKVPRNFLSCCQLCPSALTSVAVWLEWEGTHH